MKCLLGLVAAGLWMVRPGLAQDYSGLYVPFNLTARFTYNPDLSPAPTGPAVVSPVTTVSLGNKDLITLLNNSSYFTGYLSLYTDGEETTLPPGTMFYLDMLSLAGGGEGSLIVSNQFGLVPLDYVDNDNNTEYDFADFYVNGVTGGFLSKVSRGSDLELDLVACSFYFNDNYSTYFNLAGTGSLIVVSDSTQSRPGLALGIGGFDSVPLLPTQRVYAANRYKGHDAICTGCLSATGHVPAAYNLYLPYLVWWNDGN
jgi:hypothetical protein